MDRSLMKASKNLHDRWHATDGRARLLYGDVTGGRVRGFFVRRSGSLKKKKKHAKRTRTFQEVSN